MPFTYHKYTYLKYTIQCFGYMKNSGSHPPKFRLFSNILEYFHLWQSRCILPNSSPQQLPYFIYLLIFYNCFTLKMKKQAQRGKTNLGKINLGKTSKVWAYWTSFSFHKYAENYTNPTRPIHSGKRGNSRVKHRGQHQLLIGGEAGPAEANGHRVICRVTQILQHLLPVSRVLAVHVYAIDGQHCMAHCRGEAKGQQGSSPRTPPRAQGVRRTPPAPTSATSP